MDYKVTKVDKRHNGYSKYKYIISPVKKYPIQGSRVFIHKWRAWCWDSWGASSEIGYEPEGIAWTWDSKDWNVRLYLKTDKELSLFHLKWG